MLNYIPPTITEESLLQVLKALGHRNRLAILNLLMEGVQCNCEISDRLGLSLSLISHHMRILEEAGLVDSERDAQDARWVYYTVSRDALVSLGRHLQWLLDVDRVQPRAPSCGPRTCTLDRA